MIDKKNIQTVRKHILVGVLFSVLLCFMSSPAFGQQVGLYDVWEKKVLNSKTYSNPFDYSVIELKATFTSPSGKKVNFFGFYDGNGAGGQTGNVWKLRFMPDKVGTWTYTYSWTDGTQGGSGSFTVVDTGLPGPLKIATDNSWYLMTARGTPFHFRGYKISGVKWFAADPITTSLSSFQNVVNGKMVGKYNVTMVVGPGYTRWAEDNNNTQEQWWPYTGSSFDFTRYNLKVWKVWDDHMNLYANKKIYAVPFALMSQNAGESLGVTGMKKFYRYFIARNASYWHLFGWNPTWEWTDILSESQVNEIMQYVKSINPFTRLLTIHDTMRTSFKTWGNLTLRQRQSRTVFAGNGRSYGGAGGTNSSSFLNFPIIGSEDIWETPSGLWKQPRNRTEVRRGAWGIQMAGVMPIYSEWTTEINGNGKGESDIRRMFDFFYSKTKYRQYKQLNHLVSSSARQIASGKQGLEYLVYDENGGSITINLSGAGGSNAFDVLWYNPTSGATQNGGKVTGGASRTLNSPFSADTVLLLTKGAFDAPPEKVTGVKIQ